MKHIAAFMMVLVCAYQSDGLAQVGPTIPLGKTCSFFGEQLPSSVTTFESDKEAETVVRDIVRASGLAPNFSIRVGGVPNAAAVVHGSRRYIIYDQYFIRKLTENAGNKWAAISVMAHEVGHHLNGHTLEATGSRPMIELEADLFSGFVLQKLGANLDDARRAMEIFGSPTGSATHPAKADRLAAITRGWTQACEKDSTCSATQRTTTSQNGPANPPQSVPKPEPGPDSCEYAHDDTCDEPDLCRKGTDTTDCRADRRGPSGPAQAQFCCDNFGRKWCPMMVRLPLGSSCFCAGVPGSGFVCN